MGSEEMGLATELYTNRDARDNTLMHVLTACPAGAAWNLGYEKKWQKGMLQIMLAEELESL